GRFIALEDTAGIVAGQSVNVRNGRPIAHQTSGHSELAPVVNRRHRVVERQCGELFGPTSEKWIAANHEPACSQLDQFCEDAIEFTFGASIQNMEVQSEGTSSCLQRPCAAVGKSGTGWINKQGHDTRRGDQLVQQLELLRCYLYGRLRRARDVAARSVKTGDEAETNW